MLNSGTFAWQSTIAPPCRTVRTIVVSESLVSNQIAMTGVLKVFYFRRGGADLIGSMNEPIKMSEPFKMSERNLNVLINAKNISI